MMDLPGKLIGGAAVPPEHRNAVGPDGGFLPRWPNAKAMKIGYWTGLGWSAGEIARELNDGTHVNSIRGQWRRHGIVDRSKLTIVPLSLSNYELSRLAGLAAGRGIASDEWLRQIAAAAIRDDLFEAVVDS